MNQENDRDREMRPEYDIHGGVRGKYFARYKNSMKITTVTGGTFTSALVVTTTSTCQSVGIITRPTVTAYYYPSLKIRGGTAVTVDAR